MKELYLAVQNKPSLSAEARLLALLIRLAPLLGAATGAAALGYHLLALIPSGVRIYLLIPFLGFFLGMIILDQEPGWNTVLLVGFSLTAGLLLNWTGVDPSRWQTWALFLGLVTSALIGAAVVREGFKKALRVLLALTVFYLLGWLALAILDLPAGYSGLWVLAGLLLFTLITVGVLQRGKNLSPESSPVPLAIELSIMLINLFWLSGLIVLQG